MFALPHQPITRSLQNVISDGLHIGLSGKQALAKYNFGTSANVLKIKKVLNRKRIDR